MDDAGPDDDPGGGRASVVREADQRLRPDSYLAPQGLPALDYRQFTLNQNASNYFAAIEQAAYNPAHMIPGIKPSADPVLQSRLFSYPDAHRHRIGAK